MLSEKSGPMGKLGKPFFILVIFSIIVLPVIRNYEIKRAFKLFDSRNIAGHIQHLSKTGYWDKINLSEDSNVYYYFHSDDIDSVNPKQFSDIAASGDSIYKPAKNATLKLFKSDGVHYYYIAGK